MLASPTLLVGLSFSMALSVFSAQCQLLDIVAICYLLSEIANDRVDSLLIRCIGSFTIVV